MPDTPSIPLDAMELLAAYADAAAILKWVVEHDGECLGDNPMALQRARDALAKIHT